MANISIAGRISNIVDQDIDSQANIDPSKLALRNGMKFGVPLTSLRVHDAFGTVLGAAANDDLGIDGQTFGTGVPVITAGNVTGGASTRYARFKMQVPANYEADQNLSIRLRAGMLTAVCSTSCTIDVEAYRCGQDGLVDGTDLVTTAAQDMNSLTFADKDFALTDTNLLPGDEIDVRIAIAYSDGATPTTKPTISNIWQLVHTRG
jgi:hypothetical protein